MARTTLLLYPGAGSSRDHSSLLRVEAALALVGRRPAARLPLPPRGAQGSRPGPEADGLDPRRPRRDRPPPRTRRDGRTLDGRPDDHDGRRRRRRRRARRPPRRADPDLLPAAPAGQARQPPGRAPAGDRRCRACSSRARTTRSVRPTNSNGGPPPSPPRSTHLWIERKGHDLKGADGAIADAAEAFVGQITGP